LVRTATSEVVTTIESGGSCAASAAFASTGTGTGKPGKAPEPARLPEPSEPPENGARAMTRAAPAEASTPAVARWPERRRRAAVSAARLAGRGASPSAGSAARSRSMRSSCRSVVMA